jgi:hypothetical protein
VTSIPQSLRDEDPTSGSTGQNRQVVSSYIRLHEAKASVPETDDGSRMQSLARHLPANLKSWASVNHEGRFDAMLRNERLPNTTRDMSITNCSTPASLGCVCVCVQGDLRGRGTDFVNISLHFFSLDRSRIFLHRQLLRLFQLLRLSGPRQHRRHLQTSLSPASQSSLPDFDPYR